MACYNHVDFEPSCRACRGERAGASNEPLAWWAFVLVGVAAFGIGVIVGLVSALINALRPLFLVVLVLVFVAWLAYRVDTLVKARARTCGSGHISLGTVDLAGCALAAAMGLAAAGAVTAGVVLAATVVALWRLQVKKARRPSGTSSRRQVSGW